MKIRPKTNMKSLKAWSNQRPRVPFLFKSPSSIRSIHDMRWVSIFSEPIIFILKVHWVYWFVICDHDLWWMKMWSKNECMCMILYFRHFCNPTTHSTRGDRKSAIHRPLNFLSLSLFFLTNEQIVENPTFLLATYGIWGKYWFRVEKSEKFLLLIFTF
jgi:hypothetical protein